MALLKKVQVCFKSKKDRTTSTLRFASNGHTFKTMYISTHQLTLAHISYQMTMHGHPHQLSNDNIERPQHDNAWLGPPMSIIK